MSSKSFAETAKLCVVSTHDTCKAPVIAQVTAWLVVLSRHVNVSVLPPPNAAGILAEKLLIVPAVAANA
jgi:hypothetical protein